MTIGKIQAQFRARSDLRLYQPGVTRQVTKLVERGDQEHLVPGTRMTMDELHDHQLLARRLQARAAAEAFGSLSRALAWPFRKLAASLRHLGRESTAIRQLNALDDHLLADIGIPRERIPAAVAGLVGRPAAAVETAPAPAARRRPQRPEACNDAHTRAAA